MVKINPQSCRGQFWCLFCSWSLQNQTLPVFKHICTKLIHWHLMQINRGRTQVIYRITKNKSVFFCFFDLPHFFISQKTAYKNVFRRWAFDKEKFQFIDSRRSSCMQRTNKYPKTGNRLYPGWLARLELELKVGIQVTILTNAFPRQGLVHTASFFCNRNISEK